MQKLDKFEAIAHDAQFPVCILGNPQTSEYALIDLEKPLPKTLLDERGMYFIGAIGIVDGAPRVALNEPLEDATISRLSQAYLRHIADALKAAPWFVPPDMQRN